MGMYRLADGELIDTSLCTLVSRAEDIDSSLVCLPDGRLALFIWEAGIALAVASPGAAEDALELYRNGELQGLYTEES